MPHFIIFMAFAIFVSGCVLEPSLKYDPNAIKKSGIIKSVQEIESGKEFQADTMMFPVAGVFIPVQLGSTGREGNDFKYEIQTVEGQTIPILSKFGGFAINECVTLFLSQTFPPRIAPGGECK